MFPQIICEAHIAPKPVGNWCPQFSLRLKVKVRKGELEWRPWVPTTYMVSSQAFSECQLQTVFAVGNAQILQPLYDFYVPRLLIPGMGIRGRYIYTTNLVIPLPDCFYSHPMDGRGKAIHGVRLFQEGYMSPYEGDINSLDVAIEGYLPCRREKHPDYTDFLEVFSIVPKLLEKIWRDALDIGASKELVYKYQGHSALLPREEKTGETKTSPVVFI